jgi:hypothetical protein
MKPQEETEREMQRMMALLAAAITVVGKINTTDEVITKAERFADFIKEEPRKP